MNKTKNTRRSIYLDYAASTPVDARVYEKMLPFLTKRYGNSNAMHQFGMELQTKLDACRQLFADMLAVRPSEIIFTASATESNNSVLKQWLVRPPLENHHIITSVIEHTSVYNTLRWMEKMGCSVTFLPVDKSGYIQPEKVRNSIRENTRLVSIMYVNNEMGSIQPIEDIAQICKKNKVLFHCDAVQGFGKLPLNLRKLHINFLTASSHKIYGPLGAGLLYVRNGFDFVPLFHGGGQELGRRSSTVNIPAVVGFTEAAKLYKEVGEEERVQIKKLRDNLASGIEDRIRDVRINSDLERGIYNILNVSFENCDGEILVMQLNRENIAVSTGAACTAGKVKISRIVEALRLPRSFIRGTIRFSLGRFTTEDEIERVLEVLPAAVDKVRGIS